MAYVATRVAVKLRLSRDSPAGLRLKLALLPGPVAQAPQRTRQLARLFFAHAAGVLALAAVGALAFEVREPVILRVDERQRPRVIATARGRATNQRRVIRRDGAERHGWSNR